MYKVMKPRVNLQQRNEDKWGPCERSWAWARLSYGFKLHRNRNPSLSVFIFLRWIMRRHDTSRSYVYLIISRSQWNMNSMCGNMNSTYWVVSTWWFYAKSMETGGSIGCYWKTGQRKQRKLENETQPLTHVLSVREHVSILHVFSHNPIT